MLKKLVMVIPHTPAINVPMIRNGANGICDFIEYRLVSARRNIPNIPPIQNENNSAIVPIEIPSSHPIPSMSFTSPKPMNFPFEKNHNKKNGVARMNPAATVSHGMNPATKTALQTMERNESAMNEYTILSGIILCLMS